MLVLQSCSHSLHILPGSSSDRNATSGGVCNFRNTEIDDDIDVIQEIFVSINEEVVRGIKQEEIPEDITFPDIKSEPEKVSYVCYLIHFIIVQESWFFGDVIIPGQLKQLRYWEEKYFAGV